MGGISISAVCAAGYDSSLMWVVVPGSRPPEGPAFLRTRPGEGRCPPAPSFAPPSLPNQGPQSILVPLPGSLRSPRSFASPLIAEPLRRCKRARKGDGRARAPPAGASSTATPWRPPMPTHTTLPYGQPCPCRVPPTTSAGSTAPPTPTPGLPGLRYRMDHHRRRPWGTVMTHRPRRSLIRKPQPPRQCALGLSHCGRSRDSPRICPNDQVIPLGDDARLQCGHPEDDGRTPAAPSTLMTSSPLRPPLSWRR